MQIFWSKASENVFFRFYKKSCVWLRKYRFFSVQWSLRETTWCRKQISKILIQIISTHVYTVQMRAQLTFKDFPLLNEVMFMVIVDEYSIYMDTVLWHTILLDVRCSESQLSLTSNIVHFVLSIKHVCKCKVRHHPHPTPPHPERNIPCA